MFFMLHILVFITYFCDKSSTARRAINRNITDYFKDDAQEPNIKDRGRNIERDPSSHHPMFYTINNLTGTRSNDLKSNVGENILSKEMFSMKPHFFEKDSAYNSTVTKASQCKACTFETKYKWPAVNLFKRHPHVEELDEDAKFIQSPQTSLKSKYNKPKIKILDVRSLTGHQDSVHPAEIKCNCANTNGNHQCKHGDDCTRKPGQGVTFSNPLPYAPSYILPPAAYQAYFVDGALPKPTRRRKPTPQDCDLYYDDDCSRTKRPKNYGEIVMNIEYDVEDKPACVHEDLKEVNFHKRKCYCDSAITHSRNIFVLSLSAYLKVRDYIYFY